MSAESKATFFRQSGWMVFATTLSGVFLVAIYPVVNRGMPSEEVGVFMSLLRLFTVLAIPSAGLQVVMAQQCAAAITPEQKQELITRITDAVVSIYGESMRPYTWVLVDEIKSGQFGVGGHGFTTEEVRAAMVGEPASVT